MVYDEVNDMWFDDWFSLVEDFGFDPGREISHDVYADPHNIPVEVVRWLSTRLHNEVDGFYDEDTYRSRHIIAVGGRADSAEEAYHRGKVGYPEAKLVAKMVIDGHTFYVGAVPKSA